MRNEKLKSYKSLDETIEIIEDILFIKNVNYNEVSLSFEIDRNIEHFQCSDSASIIDIKIGFNIDIEFINTTKNTISVLGITRGDISIPLLICKVKSAIDKIIDKKKDENSLMNTIFEYSRNGEKYVENTGV